MPSFVVTGGLKLKGAVEVGGSKNAALPILAATLLTDQMCVIKNVPDIEDIHTMIAILKSLGSEVEFSHHTVKIWTKNIRNENISKKLGCKMRASVLLVGSLLARTGYARLPYPGGCVLGARPIDTHTEVFRQLGALKTKSEEGEIIFEGHPRACEIVMPEFSVTATENALIAACLTQGVTDIHLAAIEPHVQDLCRFLRKMGVGIDGIGTHQLKIKGKKKLKGVEYSITPDYLEAGTLVLAAILTRGDVVIKNIAPHDLDAFWNLLREMKINFELQSDSVMIKSGGTSWRNCARLQTNVFPGFPTDLQPPFVILMTQSNGMGRVHETLFEGRFAYFPDLIKMGARIERLNPHEALIDGPVDLLGTTVKSWDIRAGAAMILAALIAKGKTTINDIQYIDRGYERFDEKLRKLGAEIVRFD